MHCGLYQPVDGIAALLIELEISRDLSDLFRSDAMTEHTPPRHHDQEERRREDAAVPYNLHIVYSVTFISVAYQASNPTSRFLFCVSSKYK